MKNRIGPVLWEAVKVAITIWVVLALDPWVENNLPSLDAGWRYLLSAIAAAIILECLLQLVLGWPRLVVEWEVKDESAPINSIVARGTRRKPNSQVFVLKILTPPGGWLGYQTMKILMRLKVTLQVRIDRAGVVPTVERSSMVGTVPTVTSDAASNGVSIELGTAPRRPGKWHWANVRWEIGNAQDGVDFNVDYVLHHKSRFICMLLRVLVMRSTNVRHFQVERA